MTPADPAIDGLPDYPDHIIDTFARVLLPALRDFYADPQGQAAFAEWKQKQEQEYT